MTISVAMAGSVAARSSLDRASCLALLAPGGNGRVAASMLAIPVILPVSFTLVDDEIVFSPGPDESLARAVANCVVAFETDRIGGDGRVLWDVHVTGVARTLGSHEPAVTFRLSSSIISGWRTED